MHGFCTLINYVKIKKQQQKNQPPLDEAWRPAGGALISLTSYQLHTQEKGWTLQAHTGERKISSCPGNSLANEKPPYFNLPIYSNGL